MADRSSAKGHLAMGNAIGRYTRAGSIAWLLLLGPIGALAQEGPSEVQLQAMVQEAVPQWWELTSLELVTANDIGNAVSPKKAVRFEAEATPRSTLYAETDRVGPFAIVLPVADEDDSRTLYGTVIATYKAGIWSGAADIENPVNGLGQPDYAFATPILLSGSEESAAALNAMNDQLVAESEQKLRDELERLRLDHEAMVAKMERDRNLKAAELAQAIESMETENTNAVAALKQKLAAEMAVLENGHETTVSKAQEGYRQEIERVKEEGKAEIERVQRDAQLEIELAEAAARARADALLDTLRETEEEIALQQKIIEAQQNLLESSQELEAISAQSELRRAEVMAGLADTWTGRVDCTSTFLPWYTFTATYAMDETGSLSGQLTVTAEATSRFADQVGIPLPSTMALLSQVGDPLVLALGTQGRIRNGLLDITVEQQPDGRLTGTAGDEGECAVQLDR